MYDPLSDPEMKVKIADLGNACWVVSVYKNVLLIITIIMMIIITTIIIIIIIILIK